MKKSDIIRSHSWWWDSHNCPKSSKWLQENLTEMDSKVSAMLKIIEEDADSFAQRAEMYYKKRPELINLVEEFYRTYRALVERYTYLTREIRQNMAPAMQAQLGVSSESAQNSPVDLHLKRGLDAPDIISPSYSYTGASEFDDDSPSGVSTKGHTDDELSPLGFRTNYESRAFGFKPRFPNLEESSHKASESRGLQDSVDVDITQLQRELLRLQDENKALANKSTEDITKLKSLQVELSGLQSKVRSLEAEDKLTKKRLKSVQEKEQRLEAENLKLSHALISSKEERTELLEQQNKATEDRKAAWQKNQLLEDQTVALKQELLAAQSQVLERDEHFKNREEALQKLQQALASLEEERMKDSFLMEIYDQQSEDLHKKLSDFESQNAGLREETLSQAAEVRRLQGHLTEVMNRTKVLEQLLLDSQQETRSSDHEKSVAVSKVEDLQKELEVAQRDRHVLEQFLLDSKQETKSSEHEKSVAISKVEELQKELEEAQRDRQVLEQLLLDSKQETNLSEREKSAAISKVEELQQELEEAQRDRQGLSDQMLQQAGDIERLKEIICKLEEEGKRAQVEKAEGAKYVHKLEADIEEGQRATQILSESCQQYENRCKVLELDVVRSKEKLSSSSEEITQLQNQLTAFENMVAITELQNKELRQNVSSLVVEKTSLMDKLERVSEHVKIAEGQCAQMREAIEDNQEEIKRLKQELINQLADTKRLEESFSRVSEEKIAFMQRETESLLVHQQLENEHIQLKQQLELNSTLTKELKEKLSSLEVEKSELVLESQQLQQKLLDLNNENSVLSSCCLKSDADLEAAEEAARKVQEDLARSVSEVEKLREDGLAKGELIHKMVSNIESLETQLARFREENSLLGEEIEKCTKNLAGFEAQTNDLKSRLSDSVSVHAALAEQVSEKEKSIEMLTHELSDAHRKIIALDEDIASRTSHALGLQEQIHIVNEQMKLLHAALQENSEIKQSLEVAVEGLRQKDSEMKEANEVLVREKQRLMDEILLMEKNKQDLQANLSHLTAERTQLLEEALAHSEQCNDMKQRVMSLEGDYEAVQCESGTLRDQLTKSVEERKVLEDENRNFSKTLFDTEGRVQDLHLRVSNMLVEMAALAEQLSERMGSIHILEAALFDLQKDNTTLSEDVGLLQQQVSAARAREASLLAEMHDSMDVIQFLKGEIERLQQVVSEAEQTGKSFALEQKKSLEECLLMKEKIEDLQKDLGLLAEEKVLLMRDIATHSGWSDELECEVRRLEAEKGSLQQKLLVAQSVEDQLKEDLKNLLEETKQLSGIVDFQKKKMETQEEDMQSLRLSLSCTKEEQHTTVDKLNLVTAERAAVLQELEESQHEAKRARDDFLKVQTDLGQLLQVKATTEAELANKIEEARGLQENALILQAAKLELEEKLELSSRQVIAQEKEAKNLQEMLVVVQQENTRLESQSGDAQRRLIEVSEKCDRQEEGYQALMQELAAVVAMKKKLEEELAGLQEEKTTSDQKLKRMQQELVCLQEQKEQLVLHLEAVILQGHENETKLSNLQGKLMSAESSKLELAEKHSKLSEDWGAAESRLQEEIMQLKSGSLQDQNDLKFQHDYMLKLEDEIRSLQAEKKALQDDKALNANLMMELQEQIDGLKTQLSEKQEEVFKSSVQANCLQQSLLSIEQESADLRDLLQKNRDGRDAAEWALKDELVLKGAQITELHGTLRGLESKNEMLLEGMSMHENTNLELKNEVQLFREENKELTEKLQNSDAELVQVKANLKLLEAELRELHERLCKLQNENKSIEASYTAQAEESALYKEQGEELAGALSMLQAENAMLKTKLADVSAAVSIVNHELLALKEEEGEALKKAGLHEAEVTRLQQLLMEAQGENEVSKRQADIAAEEVSSLQTGIQTLQSQNSELNRQYQQEHERFDGSVTKLDLLQQELVAAKEENTRLSEMVSEGARSVEKLQKQVSSLYDSKQDLEGAMDHLKGRLMDSQMMLNNAQKSNERLSYESQGHSKKFLQVVSEIEDLEKMLSINQAGEQASIRHRALLKQEDFSEKPKQQAFHLQETAPMAEQTILSEATHDNVLSTGREPFSSPEHSPDENVLQTDSPLPRDPKMISETGASGLETINPHQESLFDAGVGGAIERVKEKVLTLLKEDSSSKSQSVAALAEHKVLESSVEELQEQLSHSQEEIGHLTLEVNLYKKETIHLKKILEGEEVREEGEVAHAEVKALQVMLYALQESLAGFEEKSRGLKEDAETAKVEKESSQFMLSDLQGKSLSYALLLRENLLILCKGVKVLAEEWDEKVCNRGRHQIVECIEKLCKLENSCTTSSDNHENERVLQSEGGERSPAEVEKTSPQLETLQPSVANISVLQQLQRRVEEVILLREAVEDMLPPTYRQEQYKEEEEPALNGTTEESKHSMPRDKHHDALPSHQQQQWSRSTDSIGNEFELDTEEEADSIKDHTSEGPMPDENVVERGSLDHGGEIDTIEGLARLHINLGMRLHQALMDEKLENELQELKEERKRLEEELQAHVEQVQKMEAELEKLQNILKKGSEEDKTSEPREHQHWLRRKRRAEKRVRKLSKELVLQRQQMGNMQDVLTAWTEQQELATQMLEEQVLSLVSKECAPTMEGWDADQVSQLMEEMQNRKALTRRHSMDLQSVGQELHRVGSSIESTQRQLLRKKEQEHEADQGRIGMATTSVTPAPGSIQNHHKLSRFGLTWLLLLFSTERKGLFKGRRSSTLPATPLAPKKIPSRHVSTSPERRGLFKRRSSSTLSSATAAPKKIVSRRTSSSAMSTWVAQTKKMGCCACAPSSDQLKSVDDK